MAWAPKILYGFVLDQAETDQLAEALVDLGQLRAGGDRDHHLVGQPPAELLGDLVGQRLGALGVVGPDVDVDERPALLLGGDLAGQLVHVVVAALDRDQGGVVDGGGDDLLLLEVARARRPPTDAGPGGGRGDRVGQVAGRRAGQHLQAELAGGGQGDGDHPVLEGVGRVAGVVLHPQLLAGRDRRPGCGRRPAGCSRGRWSGRWRCRPAPAAAARSARWLRAGLDLLRG